jgi:hypothetical protein
LFVFSPARIVTPPMRVRVCMSIGDDATSVLPALSSMADAASRQRSRARGLRRIDVRIEQSRLRLAFCAARNPNVQPKSNSLISLPRLIQDGFPTIPFGTQLALLVASRQFFCK